MKLYRLVSNVALAALLVVALVDVSRAQAGRDGATTNDFRLASLGDRNHAGWGNACGCGQDRAPRHCWCPATGGAETVFSPCCLDDLFQPLLECAEAKHVPIGFGAWHWFQLDTSGRGDNGYGARNVRGTYFYYVTADPWWELDNGDKIGGHLDYEFRDKDPLRTFYNRLAWSYEAYGYYQSEQLGTLKAGQLVNRFGLDWHGGFWTGVSGFDGFTRDPDYGLSWEQTTELAEDLKMDSYVQFFFHEDGINNSFAGADSESFVGVRERNTGVVRLVPTWTFSDGQSSLALGLSGTVGQIDSRRADFASGTTSAWAADATYKHRCWTLIGEALQVHGRRSPNRYVSGGPSNRITDFFCGLEYTPGPTTFRLNYQLGLDANPHGRHELFRAGTQTRLTEHVDLLVEYVNEKVYGNQTFGDLEFFDAIEVILWWHF